MMFSGPVHVENWFNDLISRARINVKIDDWSPRVGLVLGRLSGVPLAM